MAKITHQRAACDPGGLGSIALWAPSHPGALYCLGPPVARLEGDIALRALAERFPDLRAKAAPKRRTTTTVRGLVSFPLETRLRPAPQPV